MTTANDLSVRRALENRVRRRERWRTRRTTSKVTKAEAVRTGRDVFYETNPIYNSAIMIGYQNMLKTRLTEIELHFLDGRRSEERFATAGRQCRPFASDQSYRPMGQ